MTTCAGMLPISLPKASENERRGLSNPVPGPTNPRISFDRRPGTVVSLGHSLPPVVVPLAKRLTPFDLSFAAPGLRSRGPLTTRLVSYALSGIDDQFDARCNRLSDRFAHTLFGGKLYGHGLGHTRRYD